MAERKPAKNIDKLRLEAGEEQILISDFTQFEPLTSYKFGSSVMAVDLTNVDWPINGKGVVNTDKISNLQGSQSFLPKGTTTVYTRSWDTTPPDLSDSFDSPPINISKWEPIRWNALASWPYISGGELVITSDVISGVSQKKAVYSNFAFSGNFDIECRLRLGNIVNASSSRGYFSVGTLAARNNISISPNLNTGFGQFNVKFDSFIYTTTNGNTHSSTPLSGIDWKYYRIVRNINLLTYYIKDNLSDPWIEIATSPAWTSDDLFVCFFHARYVSSLENMYVDDFKVNSGTPYILSGETAIWQPWIVIPSKEEQDATSQSLAENVLLTHETNKHATGVTGSFTTTDGKTVTITDGMVTSIV